MYGIRLAKEDTKEEAQALFAVVFICCCSNLLSCQLARAGYTSIFYTDKTKRKIKKMIYYLGGGGQIRRQKKTAWPLPLYFR
jgi:hypothetical protein